MLHVQFFFSRVKRGGCIASVCVCMFACLAVCRCIYVCVYIYYIYMYVYAGGQNST